MRELIDRDDAIEAVNNRFTEAQLWDCRQIRNIVVKLLRSLPAAEKWEGRPSQFMEYVEEEAKRLGTPPIVVLAREWAAHNALKDGALWPNQDILHDTSGDASQST